MRMSSIATLVGIALATLAPSYSAFAQARTTADCRADWRANRAAHQAEGLTKRTFMAQCRGGAAPAAQPQPPTGARGAETTGDTTTTTPAQPRQRHRTATLAAGQFATEDEARGHCPDDTVVWANTKSKVYHFTGSKSFGTTKHGAFMCEKDTAAAGMRAAKNEKRPS